MLLGTRKGRMSVGTRSGEGTAGGGGGGGGRCRVEGDVGGGDAGRVVKVVVMQRWVVMIMVKMEMVLTTVMLVVIKVLAVVVVMVVAKSEFAELLSWLLPFYFLR